MIYGDRKLIKYLQNVTSYELSASTPGDLPLFGPNGFDGRCIYIVRVSIIHCI